MYKFEVPVCPEGQTTNGCFTETLTITVQDANSTSNNPVANTDRATTTSGTAVTLCALCNDTKGVNTSPLDPTSVTLPGGGTTTNGGAVTVDPATGDITYTPAAGFTGTDSYEYSVCNTTGQCAIATQIITVEPAGTNTTSASDDYAQVLHDTPVSGSVLGNDVDADGDTQTLSFASISQPGGSIAVDPSTGDYTFTPTAGFTGTVSFPYTISDGQGNSSNATLYIAVYPEEASAALPVEFGTISAWLKDGNLFVSWETLKESNVSHFEIEVSTDGKIFKKAGTSSSKAANGSSDIKIQYDESLPLSGMAAMGVSLLLLSMGAIFRKRKWLGMLLVIVGLSGMFYGCSRTKDVVSGNTDNVYVRIKQIDKDGSLKYSKVVKATIK